MTFGISRATDSRRGARRRGRGRSVGTRWTCGPLVMASLLLAAAAPPPILPLREQADFIDRDLRTRLDTIVPRLMREHGVDMWVLVAREYAEDPVVATMLDARSLHARRRTILIFFDPGGGRPLERLTVSRYGLADLFKAAWDPSKEPDQWRAFGQIVARRDPKRIVLNVSPLTAFGDGLTHTASMSLSSRPCRRTCGSASKRARIWRWVGWRRAAPINGPPIPASSPSPTGSSPTHSRAGWSGPA